MNRKLTPIASAVTLLVLGASISAQAQQAAPAPADQAPVETVTVTGIRASLQQSLTQKRDAQSHVEVITSEDIGKMPDKNVADSLQRVPGVTISSAGGTEGGFDEADRVSMRGTNPSLTLTTVNGHGIASGDWFVLDQSGTVGRSVSYTLIPSELVGSVVVHKSSEASLIEGGVAGTVDIITRKPLDFKNQFTAEATIGAVYADLPGKTDPQFNGLINWKNDQKTFGLLIQAFDEKRHLERDGQELLSWATIAPGSAVATAHPDLSGVTYPGLIGSTLFTQERTRKGGEFDAQFKVNNDFSFDVNGFISKLDAPNYNRNYMLWGAQILQGGLGQSPSNYTVTNGVLTSATFAPVAGTHYGVYDEIYRPDESETANFIALDGKLRINSDLRFTSKLGVSKGDGKTPQQDVSEQDFGTGAGANWQMNGVGSATSWMVGNAATAVAPSAATFGWVFGDQNMDVKDSENWAQIDGEYSIGQGIFTTLKFGARWNDHERKSSDIIGQGPGCAGGTPLTWSGTYNCGASTQSSYNLATLGGAPGGTYPSGFGGGLGGTFPRNVWYYTPAQLAAYNLDSNRSTNGSREDWTQEFDVRENDGAMYVQSDIEGNGWSGNFGVRFVNTNEHSLVNTSEPAIPAGGQALPGEVTASAFGNYVPIWVNHNYTDLLPSANLKFDVTKDVVIRVAASKTMTRADYSALSGVVTPGLPGTNCNGTTIQGGQVVLPAGCVPGNGQGGNPNLQPIVSNNFDTSVEWYFAPRSLLSASLFEMDLTSYVGYGSTLVAYQSAGGNGVSVGSLQPYIITSPVNISAIVKGTELAYEQPIGKDFGVNVNYTYINAADANGDPVVGASKNTYNLSGYYEDAHFNARVSYTWRSSFYSGLDRSTAFFQDSTGTLAATLGYRINDNFAVTLDGMNLNNPILRYYGAAGPSQPERFYENGRQYYLSLHLKY